jgi:hypothetical protein
MKLRYLQIERKKITTKKIEHAVTYFTVYKFFMPKIQTYIKLRSHCSKISCGFVVHTHWQISQKTRRRRHSGNYVEAKNISKVPNLRNYSICRYLEIKR